MKAPIAVPVPLKASRTAAPSSGCAAPRAKRASGVGTGEKVLVSCFICAMTRRTAATGYGLPMKSRLTSSTPLWRRMS